MKILNCYLETYNSLIVSGDNCYVIDENGKRYVDFESGIWSVSLGHGNKDVNQAIINQLNSISHVGVRYTAKAVEEAAGMLLELLNFTAGKCMFLCSGSEAVEFSVQAARRITEKPYFLYVNNGYLSAYGTAASRSNDSWLSVDLSECSDDIEEFLENIPFDKIGAFVFEAGCVLRDGNPHSKQLIKAISRKVKQSGGVIIANEVTAGIGRTGKWFGFEHFDILPGIVVCGKGIGNGYPVSVVAMSEEVSKTIEQSEFKYCQSHQNDPLGCAAVKEVISVIKRQGLIEKASDMGKILGSSLKSLADRHRCIEEVCGTGLMYQLKFSRAENFDLEKVQRYLFDSGFIVGMSKAANLFVIYPPLTVEQDMIESMVDALDKILFELY